MLDVLAYHLDDDLLVISLDMGPKVLSHSAWRSYIGRGKLTMLMLHMEERP